MKDIHIPRWLIYIIDVLICIFSVILAYLLRFNFSIPHNELQSLPVVLLFILIIRAFSFVIGKTYASIWRYSSSQDAVRIFITTSAGSLIFILTNLVTYYLIDNTFLIPFSIIIIEYLATTFTMATLRILVKVAYLELYNPVRLKSNVIIFGAGESGIFTKRALDRDAGTKYKVLAFIDDDIKKVNKKLEGVTIYGPAELENLLETSTIAHVILSIQKINPERKKEIIETCLAHNTKVLNVPPVVKWINGELSFKQIKKINIEDLLEREVIKLDEEKIKKDLIGKNILITGAAGSIGSELVRQIATFNPKSLILIDQAESPLYHIQQEFLEINIDTRYPIPDTNFIIADILDRRRMKNIFENFKPDIVYHAAAYKHVPMMELNPYEAALVNIEGTKIIADLSVEFDVQKFVMISTDKAVNPTSIMGASKRIAEIYTQSLNKSTVHSPQSIVNTRFITTRFGNVLGSNGSVIEIFKKQIDKGGPLTITHPDVNRFFMTIPEACQLVLEAGAMGNGGEIFIFNMGKSVKIYDLARKMIMLSGLTLGKDIQIVVTGLRPGEKLFEELLNDKENNLPTHHPLIKIAKVREYDFETISSAIDSLIELVHSQDNFRIVKEMKLIVPEYKSKNSVFEQLDITND
jgi:FlaA1/EpsC-like NDP-sugar epimerase